MSVIDNATAHYAAQERLIITVPEWGKDGVPLEIHCMPMTMADVNMMQKIASKKASNIEQAANIILVKAKNKEGKRLFSVTDKDKLLNQADYRVVTRIAEQIEQHFFGDIEETKGNSGATHTDTSS